MGGHLAIARNKATNDFLTDLVRRARKETVWLGATDEQKEGTWLWGDGQPLSYTNWDSLGNQPNNKQGQEHYLVLWTKRNGFWCDQPDISTEQKPGFICQWDK